MPRQSLSYRRQLNFRRMGLKQSGGATALALGAFALMATGVMAATISGPTTIHPSNFGASLTGYSCDSTEWLFVINHITGTPPASINVTFDNGSTQSFPMTADLNQNAHYSIAVTSSNATLRPTDASAFIGAGTSVGNFVLSHGSCATTGGTVLPPPPPPPATPELDSLVLLGSGGLGLVGYGLASLRARRRRAIPGARDAD